MFIGFLLNDRKQRFCWTSMEQSMVCFWSVGALAVQIRCHLTFATCEKRNTTLSLILWVDPLCCFCLPPIPNIWVSVFYTGRVMQIFIGHNYTMSFPTQFNEKSSYLIFRNAHYESEKTFVHNFADLSKFFRHRIHQEICKQVFVLFHTTP